VSVRRRGFLAALAGGAASALAPARARAKGPVAFHSVRGPLEAAALGTTLVHEHVLVDFGGAALASRARYDADEAFRVALPHLEELHRRGCRTLVECTPAYLGRDPLLLRRLSEASGLQILTNTGYYGAARDIAVPQHAYAETPRQLAARWTEEFEEGIEGTGIRPGFVKIGVDAGPLSPIDRKLVEAGALTHLATGLTLAIHTGDGRAALEIIAVLAGLGVAPAAYVWVHAQSEPDPATRAWAAMQGAWVELDGVSPQSLESHVEAVIDLRRRDRLDRVLVSQDAGWYHVGEPGGGRYRSHAFLFDTFVPALRARGLTDAEIEALLVVNPAEAFAIRRRVVRPA
jgi:predicted metal-dependent phosphotriesterase family hydrolase